MIGKQSTRPDHSITRSEIKLLAYSNHTTTSGYSAHTRLREWKTWGKVSEHGTGPHKACMIVGSVL